MIYRWSDDWCQGNLEPCAGTWQRLWGINILVGKEGGSMAECGAVPEYDAPKLVAGVTPDPIVKEVKCKGGGMGISGDRIRLLQTRVGERIMISEIQVYGSGSCSL